MVFRLSKNRKKKKERRGKKEREETGGGGKNMEKTKKYFQWKYGLEPWDEIVLFEHDYTSTRLTFHSCSSRNLTFNLSDGIEMQTQTVILVTCTAFEKWFSIKNRVFMIFKSIP